MGEDASAKTRSAVATVALAGLVGYLAFRLSDVLMSFAGSVLFAVFLDGMAGFFCQKLKLGRLAALALVGVLLVGSVAGFGLIAGPEASTQAVALVDGVQSAIDTLTKEIRSTSLGRKLLASISSDPAALLGGGEAVKQAADIATRTASVSSSIAVVLVVGAYLAIAPRLYVDAVIRLLPGRYRLRAREIVGHTGHVLRRWLVGRVASMLAIGLLTGVGLAILRVPLALSLALLAGTLSFVPYLGPILSYVPALLIALADGGLVSGLWVSGLYAGVQALEGSVITPQIEKVAVSLPPAFLIMAQLGFGVLAGMSGLILATPLAVVIVLLVQMVYLQDILGDDVEVLASESS